jgi:hypothetical protein
MMEQECDLQHTEQEVQAHQEQAQAGGKERHLFRLGGACYSGMTFCNMSEAGRLFHGAVTIAA